jgi:DNA mismatch repair ATPase MutS
LNSPSIEYAARRTARLQDRAEREHVHIRIGNCKLLTIVAGLAVAWFSLERHAASPYWLIVPLTLYIAFAVWHELILRARTRAERAAAFYEHGLARMEDRWAGNGAFGEGFRDSGHIYADDLDLFGRGSLFELLSSAQTPMGEQCLANWLTSPAPVAEIRERQSMVSELGGMLDLRENTALLGAGLTGALDSEALVSWAETSPQLARPLLRVAAAVLALLQIASVVLWVATWQYWPFFIVLMINTGIYSRLRKQAETAVTNVGSNEDGLLIFSKILKQIESAQFTSEKLGRFQRDLRAGAQPASRAMEKLAHLVNWIDARDSLLMKVIELPLLYTIQVSLAVDAWRKQEGPRTRACIEKVAEFEALLSLSAYAYEHPEDRFPELEEGRDGRAFFVGEELGHPLIAASRCVRNSVSLGDGARVLLVSGSNMSGKSTLLRTVGVNTVLAMAGAPVRAKSLRMCALALGTRIRSTDSLQEGRSNFYTEILRIRQVAALSEKDGPLLFLFDELLEGTNSHDRQIGSEALLGALLERNTVGMVTTHDLAVTRIESALDGKIHNVHFEDQIVNGEMSFDYQLRDGVVPKSNALDLMRWIGLKV